MSNEFNFSVNLQYENGKLKHPWQPSTIQLPQATKGVYRQPISATTAEADITFAGINTPGYVILHNLESTTTGKTFNWGLKSSTGGIPQYFKLPPKDFAKVCYGTSAMVLRGKMASGTAMIDVQIYEA